MRNLLYPLVLLLCAAPLSLAQMTADQRAFDFQQLAALYAKRYAPYDWKLQNFNVDLLRIRPWLERVRAARNDVEYYRVCAEYVASLQDTHSSYLIPSNFLADLGFYIDRYDGKFLIDIVDRTILPLSQYPFVRGDELVSIDGRTVDQIVADLSRQAGWANPAATARYAALGVTFRSQSTWAEAANLPEKSTVVIRRASGETVTYELPWIKSGRPLTRVGPVPSPQVSSKSAGQPRQAARLLAPVEETVMTERQKMAYQNLAASQEERPEEIPVAVWNVMQLEKLQLPPVRAIASFGGRNPMFGLPAGFQRRLGSRTTDFFFTGTYQSEGATIAYIRIPTFSVPVASQAAALAQLDTEIAFFLENADGMVVDVTNNNGGSLCFQQSLMRRFVPYRFGATRLAFRPTLDLVNAYYDAWESAQEAGLQPEQVAVYREMYDKLNMAFNTNRGIAEPFTPCTLVADYQPLLTTQGQLRSWFKPIVLLTNEFTISAADMFASQFQDANRGPIIGTRTNGAGGSVVGFEAGQVSEGFATVTVSLAVREFEVKTPGFPASSYLENAGVVPSVPLEFQTQDNLLQNGRPYVDAFTAVIRQAIREQNGK